jgi:hypothetical protein
VAGPPGLLVGHVDVAVHSQAPKTCTGGFS